MKRLLVVFFTLFTFTANSAQIANVEYIHKLIEQQHGITVPYNSELTNPQVAANMKYLLTAIDAANSILSGGKITDYGNSEYATTVVTDTVATLEMVRDHIRNYKFFATTTPDTTSFSFTISASGVFHIDWGDGTRESYRKTNTSTITYSHEYATAGEYVIKIGGYRTGGNSISFTNNKNLGKIKGSLGAIFSTIKKSNGTVSNPSFQNLFSGCTNLTGEIPAELFDGVYGQPVNYMFTGIFAGCVSLTGVIPENLFAGVAGAPIHAVFNSVFQNCYGLTGEIPEDLFAGISGAPAYGMYDNTFKGCTGLTGNIPEKLFAGISGAPAYRMYANTFEGCTGLTGNIPEKLFVGIYGQPNANMYASTFSGCSGLTGSIPDGLFGDLSGKPASSMFHNTFLGCSGLTGSIPANLFGDLIDAPAYAMFHFTFSGCTGLTGEIPDGLFGSLSGDPASYMFAGTFLNCRGLTGGVPDNLFGNITDKCVDAKFYRTFEGCSGLNGESAKMNGEFLYDIWPHCNMGSMYRGATGLIDYADIPSAWK